MDTEHRGRRTTHVVAIAAGVVALAALLWWSFGTGGGPKRARSQPDDVAPTSARVDVDLAASAVGPSVDAREVSADDRRAPLRSSTEAVDTTAAASALPCGVRVVRGDEPVAGATVELEHALYGEVLRLVTDAHGFAAVEEGTFERGLWFALAGHAGLCNRGLRPVEIDGELRQPEVLVDHTSHLALRFVRSDGAPVVPREGERVAVESDLMHSGAGRHVQLGALEDVVNRRKLRCLELAGLDDHGRVDEHHAWQSRGGSAPSVELVGSHRQIEAKSVNQTLGSAPVARGGALAVVVLEVEPNVRLATVEISVRGAPTPDAIERCDAARVLFHRGDRRVERELTRSRGARYELPEGVWEVQLAFATMRSYARPSHSTPKQSLAADAASTTFVTFDLEAFGGVELPLDALSATGRTNVAFFDVANQTHVTSHVSRERPLALVRHGAYPLAHLSDDGYHTCVPRGRPPIDTSALEALGVSPQGRHAFHQKLIECSQSSDPALVALFEPFRVDVIEGVVSEVDLFSP